MTPLCLLGRLVAHVQAQLHDNLQQLQLLFRRHPAVKLAVLLKVEIRRTEKVLDHQ